MELEPKQKREERLQDMADREVRPWLAQLRDIDEIGRGVVFLSLFLIAAVLILWIFDIDMSWAAYWFMRLKIYAFILAAFVVFYRDILWEWITALSAAVWKAIIREYQDGRQRRENRRIQADREGEKEARESAPIDSFEGVDIGFIAGQIAESKTGALTLESLQGLGLRSKAAQKVQAVLKQTRFLVYPISIRPDMSPLGDEPIAYVSDLASHPTMLNPILMATKSGDRARIVGNAIRRERGLLPEPEPRITSDGLTVMGHAMSALGHERQAHAKSARPDA